MFLYQGVCIVNPDAGNVYRWSYSLPGPVFRKGIQAAIGSCINGIVPYAYIIYIIGRKPICRGEIVEYIAVEPGDSRSVAIQIYPLESSNME